MTELMPGIKQISQTGNDMYIQGAFPVGIGNTDVAYLADPADTHLLASRDPVIKEISVGMTGNEIKEEYVTGAPPLTLSDSEGYPLQWWQVTLSPYQEGSGDPAPDNVRPIHGTDKVTVWTAGKNLFNPSDKRISKAIFGNDPVGGPATLFDSTATDTYVNVAYLLAGQTYTLSHSRTASPVATANRVGYICDDNGVVLQSVVITWINGQLYVQITPTVSGWLWASMDKNVTDIQLEPGSTASDYTPYIATSQTVINLPSTVYTATIGSDGGESRTRYRLYNGDSSEQWTYSSAWSKTNTAVFYSDVVLTDALFTNFADTYITNCNLFRPKSRQVLYDYDTQGIAYSGNTDPGSHYLTVRIPKTIASTVEEFTAFLVSNPLEVVYMLIDPVQFSLTTPSISTPKGTATTWATAEDGVVDSMEVTYVGKA